MDLTKSFAENNGVIIPFNWNSFLNRKDINNSSWLAAKHSAKKWVTCAVGTQCSILPRMADGAPKDTLLFYLGINFMNAIECRNTQDAKFYLKSIEERSAYLINEIKNGSN